MGSNVAAVTRPDVSLRRFHLSDLDAVMEWATDEPVLGRTRWNVCRTRDDALHFLRTTIIPHPWCRAVCIRRVDSRHEEEELIAAGFLFMIPFLGMEAIKVEMSGGLARRHWGRGVMPAALGLAVAEVFAVWPWVERIESHTSLTHVAAILSMEKAGFHRDGVLERDTFFRGKVDDSMVYSVLRPRSKF